MTVHNRIERLSSILSLLHSGIKLSTPTLVQKFNVSSKIIQTDFKEYLIPLFNDETIFYSYDSKSYLAKNNFLTKTFLTADELALIAILKNKSKDKYSDSDLYEKVNMLFKNYEDVLSHSIYTLSDIEKIDKFKTEIIQIQHAIDRKKVIKCVYRDKARKLYPLQIKNFDGFWYLICFDTNYQDIRKYHLNSITDVVELIETYTFDIEIIEKFDNAINAYFKPELEAQTVQLFLDEEVSKYFLRKPISKTQRVIQTYNNGSCDIELYVSDFMEIIPSIQKFIPHVLVIEPSELKIIIDGNLEKYLKKSN